MNTPNSSANAHGPDGNAPPNSVPHRFLADVQPSPLHRHFTNYLARLGHEDDPAVLRALRIVSESVEQGAICVNLETLASQERPGDAAEGTVPLPPLDSWLQSLRKSKLVGTPGDFRPLILDGHRLYLARYWRYEQQVAARIGQLASDPIGPVDTELLRRDLDHWFGRADVADPQKQAAALAVLKRFCLIAGGPGTGKTSTVVKILAALQSQAAPKALRIAVAAPTGKAAGRIQAAIREKRMEMNLPAAIREGIPDTAQTLHRLLGTRPNSIHFRHSAANPLPFDVVVVDEASMVDLALLAKLLEALPNGARLILLGDQNQLAAVAPGSVFADLCLEPTLGPETAARLSAATGYRISHDSLFVQPLSECVALLTYSHRFGPASGIGTLASLINHGQSRSAVDLLRSGRYADLSWEPRSNRTVHELESRMAAGYAEYFAAVDANVEPSEILRRFDRFRVLTAHRKGTRGADGINRSFERWLGKQWRLAITSPWYPGRAVMIRRNDYALGLFNGDIGVCLPTGQGLRVYFESSDGKLRDFAPTRLPTQTTAFAMTVHRGQGSEFDEILLALPETDSPILDRALIYTGLTRAKNKAQLLGPAGVLEAGIKRAPAGTSALRERLSRQTGS